MFSFSVSELFSFTAASCWFVATFSSVISVFSPQKHGLVIIPDGTPNGDVNHEPLSSGITVVSQEAAQVLESAGEGPLGESEDDEGLYIHAPRLVIRINPLSPSRKMQQIV